MSAILHSLNVHNLHIFHPILRKLVSKFMVHKALSDKTYLSLGLLSPLSYLVLKHECWPNAFDLGLNCLLMPKKKGRYRLIWVNPHPANIPLVLKISSAFYVCFKFQVHQTII